MFRKGKNVGVFIPLTQRSHVQSPNERVPRLKALRLQLRWECLHDKSQYGQQLDPDGRDIARAHIKDHFGKTSQDASLGLDGERWIHQLFIGEEDERKETRLQIPHQIVVRHQLNGMILCMSNPL